MGFTHPCGTNDHQIGGDFEPIGLHKLHDLIPGDFRIKFPVKIGQEFNPFHTGHFHEILDAPDFSFFVFLQKKVVEEALLILREGFLIRQQPEVLP